MAKFIYILMTVSILISCSSDENTYYEPLSAQPKADFSGKYLLVAFNTEPQSDMNSDGLFSTNQMEETDCFNETIIEFKDNYTYTINPKNLYLNGNKVTCISHERSGTWTKNGNVISLHYPIDGEPYTENMILSADEMVLSETANGILIVRTNSDGTPVNGISTVDIVFHKQ